MFPFWEPVIAPVLAASGARRVVEVGALRGDTTIQIIEQLGPEGVLHVVDPVPGFDPAEHEQAFPGRYVFHQGRSVDVLAGLAPMDAALLDGDHNWYTVRRELELLDAGSRAARVPLPLLFLHDVGWPYGRRDLYYDPASVPAEHRQPHRRAGMRPGRAALLPEGQGMSQGMWNAETEGGARNGVMTAVDDFVAESDRALRVVVLPLYFGLAIVVEGAHLEAHPGLTAELDRLESAEGRLALIEVGEQIRLRAVAHHHTVAHRTQQRIEGLAGRYLDGVARELAGEDEVAHRRLRRLRDVLDETRAAAVPGDVVVGGPDVASLLALTCADREAHALTDRTVWWRAKESNGPDEGRRAVAHLRRLGSDDEGPRPLVAGDPVLGQGEVAVIWADADGAEQLREHLTPGGSVIVDATD